jgi:uncharacterized repeat protein (TIGR01451 family)
VTCLSRREGGAHPLTGLVVAVVVILALAAPASAQLPPLPTGNCPLPGSSFQGGDGDQAAPTGPIVCEGQPSNLRDWESLQENGLRHLPDPDPADASEFGGGTDQTAPGDWYFVREGAGGVNPGQSDIKDGWSAVTQPGGNTFLYLGFTRGAQTGTNQINVELNHDPQPWRNPRGADVPCRRDGDLLIGYLPKGNDPDVSVVLYRWETTSAATQGRPCALRGTWTRFANLPPGSAQGRMNPQPITNLLRDGFYDVGQTMDQRVFGEAALNLTRLLGQVLDDPCVSFGLISMHSNSSDSAESAMKDWVKPRPLTVRTCSAAGTKFWDRNADGDRDPEEDPPLANWLIWADYNPFNGVRDPNEPFAITDEHGEYVINDIRPGGDGTYMLRETLLGSARLRRLISNAWRCSAPTTTGPGGAFPCAHGPINVNETPYAQGRDFGNWLPARITVEKEHFPPEPPEALGRFQIFVGTDLALDFPSGGSSNTVFVEPGSYDVSEVAVPPTDLSQYEEPRVYCQTAANRRARQRRGIVFENLTLLSGQHATCTFTNVRLVPAIHISKSARPLIVEAGDTITYTLDVTNPGRVSFAAADVHVTDSRCDDDPELVEKQHVDESGELVPDDSPDTLDQDDVWTYRCTHKTPAAGDDCQAHRVRNTAEVEGTANEQTVTSSDEKEVAVLCPDRPVPPGPEPPGPEPPPGPQPPGPGPGPPPPAPRPPDADSAGQAGAGALFRTAIRGCIGRRVPRVNFTGTKVARIAVFVNGRLRRNLTVQTLQRRVTPRVTVAPGRRYGIAVRVTFQRGSGTPPVTLRGTFRTCPAGPPAVTG